MCCATRYPFRDSIHSVGVGTTHQQQPSDLEDEMADVIDIDAMSGDERPCSASSYTLLICRTVAVPDRDVRQASASTFKSMP